MMTTPQPGKESPASTSFPRVLLIALLLILTCGAIYLFLAAPLLVVGYSASLPLHESSASMPRIGLAVVAFGSMWELLRLLRGAQLGETDEYDLMDSSPARSLMALVALALYVIGVWGVGYIPATLLFVWLMSWAAGIPVLQRTLLASILCIVLYTVFIVVLRVAVPPGFLLR